MKTTNQKRQFLIDTIEWYKIHSRGVKIGTSNTCSYSAGCAIGRHLSQELCHLLDSKVNEGGASVDRIFDYLPSELKEYGKDFLTVIQKDIHDEVSNWQSNDLGGYDLTGRGIRKFDEILKSLEEESI